MSKIKPLTKAENTVFASLVIEPILHTVDMITNSDKFPIERIRKTLEQMEDHVSTVQAFPFPETMDKAGMMRIQNEIMEHIVDIIELREKQKELTLEQSEGSSGMKVLKQLGF